MGKYIFYPELLYVILFRITYAQNHNLGIHLLLKIGTTTL